MEGVGSRDGEEAILGDPQRGRDQAMDVAHPRS